MPRTWSVRLAAMTLTESVRSFQVPATPGTSACPPSLPSVPTSRATRGTSAANERSWSTIVLMVFLSSRISPFTSTVIFRDRSPRATAVVTSAMLRTCAVRFAPIAFTESVKSFQVPATPGTTACPPRRPSVLTSRATRVTSEAKERSCSTIVLMASLSERISPRTSTVIFRDRSPLATAIVTSAMLRTWLVRLDAMEFTLSVRSFHVPATPGTSACPPSLPSVPTSRPTRLTSDANPSSGSAIELIHHRIDGVLQLENLAADVHRDFAREIASCHSGCYFGDISHLRGQVGGHRIYRIRQVLPGAGYAWNERLATELALGADFA